MTHPRPSPLQESIVQGPLGLMHLLASDEGLCLVQFLDGSVVGLALHCRRDNGDQAVLDGGVNHVLGVHHEVAVGGADQQLAADLPGARGLSGQIQGRSADRRTILFLDSAPRPIER